MAAALKPPREGARLGTSATTGRARPRFALAQIRLTLDIGPYDKGHGQQLGEASVLDHGETISQPARLAQWFVVSAQNLR